MTRLERMLRDSPYQGYAYAYPHKTAYRRLPQPLALRDVWTAEARDALFLYVHVPFCEMRCGFCNLFTQAGPRAHQVADYLEAVQREVRAVRHALGDVRIARFAVGGGTPTFLDEAALEGIFDWASELGAAPGIPMSVETSPATATREKLALLRRRGVTRISLGVQSFVESEAANALRPQKTADVERALEAVRGADFPTLNLDLIYGLPGQTVQSWLDSVAQALRHRPEELYLYPLYVRPVTTLERSGETWEDVRLSCYREARALLLSADYEQISMRMFRARGVPAEEGPAYCCQDDGMVGIGCGARSYTRGLHYSREFAVGARGIRAILSDYLARPTDRFAFVDYGFRLDTDEQRRRHVLQSLLQGTGLTFASYLARFGSQVLLDYPELLELEQEGLAERDDTCLRLTPAGLERSDTIGPWLYSECVRDLMNRFELR